MRIGMSLNYAGGFAETVAELADYEKAGLDIVFVPEAYSFDAVSQLGFIAAQDASGCEIASGILQLYTRTPTLTAMTAAGLDYVSGGRFTLGIGASGPQVIEGWHGVPYDAPVGRTREIIEICRHGLAPRAARATRASTTRIPLPADQGTGLGKPLKLINHPVRERIPIVVAALGPKNVELAAELAEGWEPIFFLPGEGRRASGATPLADGQGQARPRAGAAGRGRAGPLAHRRRRRRLSWSSAARHARAVHRRHGRARARTSTTTSPGATATRRRPRRSRTLYLAGRKEEAAALVPAELLAGISLIGPRAYVAERIAALKEAGVTTLNVTPLAGTHADRVRLIERGEGAGRRPVSGAAGEQAPPALGPAGGRRIEEARRCGRSRVWRNCGLRSGRISAPAGGYGRPEADRPVRRRHRRPPVDPRRPGSCRVRALRHAPSRTAILTVSLLPAFGGQTFAVEGVSMTVNYGLNKVRFPAPVPVGSRVRGHSKLLDVTDVTGGVRPASGAPWRSRTTRSPRASPRSCCATCSEHREAVSRREDVVVVDAVICEPIRTPVGGFGGALRDVPVQELGATVIRALVGAPGCRPTRSTTSCSATATRRWTPRRSAGSPRWTRACRSTAPGHADRPALRLGPAGGDLRGDAGADRRRDLVLAGGAESMSKGAYFYSTRHALGRQGRPGSLLQDVAGPRPGDRRRREPPGRPAG